MKRNFDVCIVFPLNFPNLQLRIKSVFHLIFFSIVLINFSDAPCNVTNTTDQTSDCPKESKCIEIGHNVTQGNCVCPVNFTINSEFFKLNTTGVSYCLKKENVALTTTTTTQSPVTVPVPPNVLASTSTTTTTTIKPIVVSTKQPEVTTFINNNNKKPNVIDDEVKIQPAVEIHHFFGGILLPILIVFAFIASAFAIKKYDLIDKAHGFIRQRYHHSQYDGIIMENDFDDDPLLI